MESNNFNVLSFYNITPSKWNVFFNETEPELTKAAKIIECMRKKNDVFPENTEVLQMFKELTPDDIKVLIIGQDPYPTKNIANGIAFSTSKYNPIPSSLRNIYKELEIEGFDGHKVKPSRYYLEHWVKQGVFLINSSLTSDPNMKSHAIMWTPFVTKLCKYIKNQKNQKVVVILFGTKAKIFKKYFDSNYVLETSHPAPNSCDLGFFYSMIFKNCNEKLNSIGIDSIHW